MAASTAPREALEKPGQIQYYNMGTGTINKGTMVSLRTDGLAYPARSGTATDIFVGVAYETVTNPGSGSSPVPIRILKTGSYVFGTAAATAQTQIGQMFYAADDQTVTTTAANNQFVGYACEIVDSTDLRIRINRAVN